MHYFVRLYVLISKVSELHINLGPILRPLTSFFQVVVVKTHTYKI